MIKDNLTKNKIKDNQSWDWDEAKKKNRKVADNGPTDSVIITIK